MSDGVVGPKRLRTAVLMDQVPDPFQKCNIQFTFSKTMTECLSDGQISPDACSVPSPTPHQVRV